MEEDTTSEDQQIWESMVRALHAWGDHVGTCAQCIASMKGKPPGVRRCERARLLWRTVRSHYARERVEAAPR